MTFGQPLSRWETGTGWGHITRSLSQNARHRGGRRGDSCSNASMPHPAPLRQKLARDNTGDDFGSQRQLLSRGSSLTSLGLHRKEGKIRKLPRSNGLTLPGRQKTRCSSIPGHTVYSSTLFRNSFLMPIQKLIK